MDVALPTKPDCTRRPPPGWDAPLVTHFDGEEKSLVFLYFKYATADSELRYVKMFSEMPDVIACVFYVWQDLLASCMDTEPVYLVTDSIEAIRGVCTWCDSGERKTNYMMVGDLDEKQSLEGIPAERLDISAVRII